MTIIKKKIGNLNTALALGLSTVGSVGAMSVMTVTSAFADAQVTAGSFDLTKQATSATFPVMFDRPSGVNAAALAGAIRNLGSDSELYKSAVASVPELANSQAMTNLLSNALSTDSSVSQPAKATIVKLINWYNGLGGTKVTTQSGAAYTVDNLNEPVNTIAIAFSNKSSINSDISRTIDQDFKNVRTVQDVMNIFDKYKAGSSAEYKNAFNNYASKVYAQGADISALSSYASVKPVLDSYEKMYAEGAATIRQNLLNGSTSTEAAVVFFESAIITGRLNNSDGGNSNSNTPTQEDVTTRYVGEDGTVLHEPIKSREYQNQKSFDGWTFKEVKTENGTRTYTYRKNKQVTEDTVWVDVNGKELKPEKSGTYPDREGDDVPGFVLVSHKTTTDNDGNSHTVNTYKEKPKDSNKPDTYWFDEDGKQLKDPAIDQTLPDTEGDDIPGYELVTTHTITKEDLNGRFKGTAFGEGDVINIYKQKVTPTPEPPKPDTPKPDPKPEPKVVRTRWVSVEHADDTDEKNDLKKSEEGAHPDKEGDDLGSRWKLVRTETLEDGNVKNVYERVKVQTRYLEKGTNKPLKDTVTGDDFAKSETIKGYTLVNKEPEVSKDGLTHTYYYSKPLTTRYIDKKTGKELKTPVVGETFAKDEVIKGYKILNKDNPEEKDGTRTYYYGQLTTHYKERGTNKPLTDDIVGDVFGSEKDFTKDGYVIDGKPEVNKDGDDLTYYYKKKESPKQDEPKQDEPKKSEPKKELPNTGEASSMLSLLGMLGFGGVTGGGLFSRFKRKK